MQPITLTFCGAAGEVSGSCYLLEAEHTRLLIDCGAFQGNHYAETLNALPFPFVAASIGAVIITHAHFDHVGRLPKLLAEGFSGPIYATAATAELAMLTLRDSAHLIAEEARRHGHEPLFTEQDVQQLAKRWKPLPYHQVVTVLPGVTATSVDAGHILGSASIALTVHGKRVAFSGDLGNTPAPLLNGTEFLHGAEYALLESTYGTRVHEQGITREELLVEALTANKSSNGTLLLPAFAVERSQELLYTLNYLFRSNPQLRQPIFLDSPLASAATEVFERHHELLQPTLSAKKYSLFTFPELTITTTPNESKAIQDVKGAKVIIAGSGMMNGGRILHHLSEYLSHPTTTLYILGYQADGTLGRLLQEGATQVTIHGQSVPVNALVKSASAFSGHADRPRLLRWVEELCSPSLKGLYIVHGEQETAEALAASLREIPNLSVSVPTFSEKATLS